MFKIFVVFKWFSCLHFSVCHFRWSACHEPLCRLNLPITHKYTNLDKVSPKFFSKINILIFSCSYVAFLYCRVAFLYLQYFTFQPQIIKWAASLVKLFFTYMSVSLNFTILVFCNAPCNLKFISKYSPIHSWPLW